MEEKKTHLSYRIIRGLVRIFSPKYELSGTEHLPDEPCIIVGNHCQIYGPIAAELYIPGKHATWCAGEMMHKDEVAAYAYKDFWSGKPENVRWFYKLLSHLIVPLSVLVFNDANTVPVYHDSRIISTFRTSISLLQQGSSVVIFPECYDRHNNIIYKFQEGFIDLARLYYKKTHQELYFVPMYIAPYPKKMCFGKPTRFNADKPVDQERERICKELMDSVTELAVSLPLHTVVPYPNIDRKFYPNNIPLEVYHD